MIIFTKIFLIFLGALFGAVLGIEREKLHKAAGVRTYGLVALGSTLLTIIARETGNGAIAAQIVTGIGFLGAGVIFLEHEKNTEKIHNLTTAAGMWVTAAIGIAVGYGEVELALFVTVLAIVLLYLLRRFNLEAKLEGKNRN